MKKTLITLLLFIFSFSYSQNFSCGTNGFIPHSTNFNRPSIPGPVDPDSTIPYVLNAHFTLVKGAGGSLPLVPDGQLVTNQQIEAKFLDCIKILNIIYNPYNIYFKYRGYESVTNSNNTLTWDDLSQYKQSETMNFYFVNGFTDFDTTVSAGIIGGTESVYLNYALTSSTQTEEFLKRCLVHQVAHNLSLYHTYEVGSHFDPQIYPDLYNATLCERVNRIPSDNITIYNADIA